MEPEAPDFDVLAASLRADSSDLTTFVEVLATKLEGALPGATRVERGGLFGPKRVKRITVELGDERFDLTATGGKVEPMRASAVRGIVLKREPLSLDRWIEELSRRLAAEATESEQARLALQRLLMR